AENRPARDAAVYDPLSVRNPLTGVRAAKVAKLAKDRELATTDDPSDWSAEDWRALFDERAGFAEHDGGGTRVEAGGQAFEWCIVEWLNRNPSSSAEGRCCTWCGEPETPSAVVVPFGGGEQHEWLHAQCWPAWHQSRRVEAAAALRAMGIEPEGRKRPS